MGRRFNNPWGKEHSEWFKKEETRDRLINITDVNFQKRPSWQTLFKAYPGPDVITVELYKKIGGFLSQFNTQDKLNNSSYLNSCAFRMSYGLNKSGLILPYRKDKRQLVLRGSDNLFYWGRVKELYLTMVNQVIGSPDYSVTLKKARVGEEKQKLTTTQWNNFKGRKGIVAFEVSGWGDAFGHYTLWNGSNLIYPGNANHDDPFSDYYYFNMKYERQKNERTIVIQTDKIHIWYFE